METKLTYPLPQVLIPFQGLRVLGISFSRVHLRRLVNAGRFPPPVRPSEGRVAWRSGDIQNWLANLPTGHIDRSQPAKKARTRKRA